MSIAKAKLYFNTIKFLKFEQIVWRLKYRFFKVPKPICWKDTVKTWEGGWCAPRWNKYIWDGHNAFSFLEQSNLIVASGDWQDKSKDALWLYNLHYLDCLTLQDDLCPKQSLGLVNRWIKDNPDPNTIGWDPYCISLRLVNLIKWMSKESIFDDNLVESIEKQANNLLHKIEFHVQANHLFTNIKALIFVGCFLEGKTGRRCLVKGLKLFDKQLKEQFGSDGGHYEVSPMYHQILMWDLLDLTLLATLSAETRLLDYSEIIKRYILNAQKWRLTMLHSNSEIAFFNDAAMDIAPPNEVIEEYLDLLDLPVSRCKTSYVYLVDSGFHVFDLEDDGKIIFDCGGVGPDYQPGHAHADTLSFEMSLFGKKLFVNSGTSMYGTSVQREYQRSTQAHNTVTIDNKNSSQVWGGFRVAKRARIVSCIIEKGTNLTKVTGAHDGFKQQNIAGIHSRSISVGSNTLTVCDSVEQLGVGCALARFYLHPEVNVDSVSTKVVKLLINGKQVTFGSNGIIRLVDSQWFPKFGAELKNQCIEVEFKADELKTEITW